VAEGWTVGGRRVKGKKRGSGEHDGMTQEKTKKKNGKKKAEGKGQVPITDLRAIKGGRRLGDGVL